jgi:hypothetical protein
MSLPFTESVVEEAALAWFQELGYTLLRRLLFDQLHVKDAERIAARYA